MAKTDRVHVFPEADLIEHERNDEATCVCGPIVKAVFREDGSNGWMIIHQSLDGREHFLSAPESKPRQPAYCSGASVRMWTVILFVLSLVWTICFWTICLLDGPRDGDTGVTQCNFGIVILAGYLLYRAWRKD